MLWYLLVSNFLVIIVIMNDFVYVVSLTGKHVFHDWSIQYVIKHMDDLDKVRIILKEKYNVEFEKLAGRFSSIWWEFDNITDNRDIYLIVERVDVID